MLRVQLPVGLGLSLLIILEIIGLVLLTLSANFRPVLIQAILFLIAMIIIWYAAHPLSHFTVAKLYGVSTTLFFLAPSDMGKSGGPAIQSKISQMIITVGTKLNHSEFISVSKNHRAWILGSPALIGVVVLALIEAFAILSFEFNFVALVLGGLFFLLTIGTELKLSTKSGDLSKMKKELSKAK